MFISLTDGRTASETVGECFSALFTDLKCFPATQWPGVEVARSARSARRGRSGSLFFAVAVAISAKANLALA